MLIQRIPFVTMSEGFWVILLDSDETLVQYNDVTLRRLIVEVDNEP